MGARRRLGFHGSPTILVDGQDPFATGAESIGHLFPRSRALPRHGFADLTKQRKRLTLRLAAACGRSS